MMTDPIADMLTRMRNALMSGASNCVVPGSRLKVAILDTMKREGFIQNYETAMIAGDFHSGPLSVLIGFGLPGTVAFVGFLFASWRVMRSNFQRGPPELRRINTFLYAYFLCRVVFFFAVFGDFASDMAHFAGIVGISVALNGDGQNRAATTTTTTAPPPKLA